MKRKLDQDDDGVQQDQGVTKRERTSKSKRELATPSENLWAKLPGELKNRIYEFALIEDHTVHVGVHHKTKHARKIDGRKADKWREPGLLRVTKEIRSEALPIYYENNYFKITISATDSSPAVKWLLRKVEYRSGIMLKHIRLDKLYIATTDLTVKHVASACVVLDLAFLIWAHRGSVMSQEDELEAWESAFAGREWITGSFGYILNHLITTVLEVRSKTPDYQTFKKALLKWIDGDKLFNAAQKDAVLRACLNFDDKELWPFVPSEVA